MTEKLRELISSLKDQHEKISATLAQIANRIERDADVLTQREREMIQREEACEARERALQERESKLKKK
jgi:uncharacterized protein involved in exopolysaccharide biosynthesis